MQSFKFISEIQDEEEDFFYEWEKTTDKIEKIVSMCKGAQWRRHRMKTTMAGSDATVHQIHQSLRVIRALVISSMVRSMDFAIDHWKKRQKKELTY